MDQIITIKDHTIYITTIAGLVREGLGFTSEYNEYHKVWTIEFTGGF